MHQVSIPAFALERGRLMRPRLALDPKKTAVIAIDFQRFFIDEGQPMGNAHARDILDNANRLHAAVRDAGGMVVFTQHSMGAVSELTPDGELALPLPESRRSTQTLAPGSPSYNLHPKMTRDANDVRVIKFQSSPLHPRAATTLDAMLRDRGIENVIITGLVTNGCCDCTARDAFQHGYNVVVATDATAAMTDDEHNAALLNLAIYYAHTKSVDEIVDALSSNE
jgi:nicotinamidase-related amidase